MTTDMSISPYPVVSRQVLKQALAWMSIPAPKLVLEGAYKWPDGSHSCIYRAEWSQPHLERALHETFDCDGCAGYMRFLARVRDSFCGDINMVWCYANQPGRKVIAQFYCKLPR